MNNELHVKRMKYNEIIKLFSLIHSVLQMHRCVYCVLRVDCCDNY